ncbi:rare lipoprotein A [Arachidicoccus rhizosphaerae]|uniref:Rare lipoprotein A n=2 Tax=Arachidicoccus rhizosphaerae TaxID=551991 RepID=A0A1H3Z7P3_9BACT|nr:rare lipoprotein A [Arachidicoccus rhizosphaerae]
MYRGFNFCVPATYNDMDCIEMKAQCVRLSGRAFVFGLLFAGLGLLVPVGSSKLYAQSVSKSIRVTKTDDGRKMVYGKATHYSRSLEGTKTAIGTRYHNDKYTAASNFFKLRTWVKVTRLSNGRSVTVFINDRMHPNMASKGRVIDLSIAAAQSIHFLSGAGITRVKVEEVPKPEITEPLKSNQSAPESEISEYDR